MKESNVRNLTKTLAVLSLLAPAAAHPLGIGGIKLHSALNQNLNAEISLVLSQGEKLSDIKVHLAPPDKFDEAGVPWNSFLSKIKFEPVVRPDGTVVIRLSSREALKEPFLGLLLEVSWPKGSLYREFSVLVDPPVVYEQPTIPVVKLPEKLSSEPVISSTPTAEARPVQSTVRSSSTVKNKYGPTTRKDTLWKISEPASRRRNVSVEQMMIAIYQDNPSAFFKENINALRLGKTLKIPEREAIVKLSRKQALAEYERHTQAWKNRITPAPVEKTVTATIEQPAKENQRVENQLNLEAPSEASVLENAVITPGQEQSTAGVKSQVTGKSGKDAQTDAVAGAYDDLQHKVLEMQEQLAKMQELIAIKDQQLAALQQQTEPQQITPAPEQVSVQSVAQLSNQEQSRAVSQPSDQALLKSTVQTNEQNSPVVPLPKAQQAATEVPPDVEQISAKPKVKQAVQPRKPIQQQEMVPESDPFNLTIGALGLGLFSGLSWLWWRKRKIDAKTDTESMFATSIMVKPIQDNVQSKSAHIVPQLSDDSGIYNVEPVGESSFLSEFTPSDFDAFDTDQGEIDPVSEADVYLAYGRYQQAEELMRQAIIEQPHRDECKLKLLEIFYANENKNAFENYANELATSGRKADKGFWDKVAEMGNEICPDSALFSFSSNRISAQDAREENCPNVSFAKKHDDALSDFDSSNVMDLGDASFDQLLNADSVVKSTKVDTDEIDFEISLSGDEESFGNKGDGQPNDQTMEFDLGSLSSFNTDSVSLSLNEKPAENLFRSDESTKDFDLELFDFNLDRGSIPKKDPDAIDLMASNDKEGSHDDFMLESEFDFDFDLSEDDEQEPHDLLGVADLTDMDEFETKLDLARAYMDMGDEASAKEIVEQVLEKGSDDQKKVAQRIIDHLA